MTGMWLKGPGELALETVRRHSDPDTEQNDAHDVISECAASSLAPKSIFPAVMEHGLTRYTIGIREEPERGRVEVDKPKRIHRALRETS